MYSEQKYWACVEAALVPIAAGFAPCMCELLRDYAGRALTWVAEANPHLVFSEAADTEAAKVLFTTIPLFEIVTVLAQRPMLVNDRVRLVFGWPHPNWLPNCRAFAFRLGLRVSPGEDEDHVFSMLTRPGLFGYKFELARTDKHNGMYTSGPLEMLRWIEFERYPDSLRMRSSAGSKSEAPLDPTASPTLFVECWGSERARNCSVAIVNPHTLLPSPPPSCCTLS
jgi:hypothetical protein